MRLVIACFAVLALAGPASAAAPQRGPKLFFGTNWDAEISKNAPPTLQGSEWARMRSSGVATTRVLFEWTQLEPEQGAYNWTTSDRQVTLAVSHGIDLLPVVIYAPAWARVDPDPGAFASPPKDPADYARFMTALIDRYGASGSFWTEHPELPKRPLRTWQIWNEPHLGFQWAVDSQHDDYAKGYGQLLRVAYQTIKKDDPRATVVLAGLANRSFEYLDALYRRGKVRGSFDVAALHPYTSQAAGTVELTRRFHAVMDKFHDGKKPIWITELGLPASKGAIDSQSTLQTTDSGMAKWLEGSYRELVKARGSASTRVDRVYQYTWASVYCCDQFRFTGLLRYDNNGTVTPKPALAAYVRAAKRYGPKRPRSAPRVGAAAARTVPHGFFGTVVDGPLFDKGFDLEAEMNTMVGAGVESIRATAEWNRAQPYKSFRNVPDDERSKFRDEGGVPTDYSTIDALVAGAAQRGLSVLPVVLYAPPWAARHQRDEASPPRDPQAYARFVGLLARRYGPDGSFWREHPELVAQPIRQWQIWNEPSTTFFWTDQPSAHDYVDLLRRSRKALKAVDPAAQIVLAGLPNASWKALNDLYAAGAHGLFDIAAVHPFTLRVSGVVTLLKRFRRVMRRHGDGRVPIMVTELSWPTAAGKVKTTYGFEVTEAGQRYRIRQALPLLARARNGLRLVAVYWYTWMTRDRDRSYPFDFAGLTRIADGQITRKPGFDAFRETVLPLEGCGAKVADARVCTS